MLHLDKPSQAGEECAVRRNSDAQFGEAKYGTLDEGERSNLWNSVSAKLSSPLYISRVSLYARAQSALCDLQRAAFDKVSTMFQTESQKMKVLAGS